MLVYLIAGFALLVKGADLFVDGACTLAEKLKIPAYIVGLTVVAFGTSLPEAAVSITASIQNRNSIAIGNIIGSNIFNTLMVLGFSALFAPILVQKNILKRDLPFCLEITALLLVLILTMNNGIPALTRFDGVVLLVIFVTFMIGSIMAGKKEAKRNAALPSEKEAEMPMWKCLLFITAGLAGVIVGGQFTVSGATSMAEMLGMSETVIGLTVVAIGTSLPELVTSIVAARKHQNDIAIGNVIGSNIFNILFILGMSAAINTIEPGGNTVVVDVCVLLAVMAFIYLFLLFKKKLELPAGLVMIGMYLVYTAYLLVR